jgi:hypothetical protein
MVLKSWGSIASPALIPMISRDPSGALTRKPASIGLSEL